MYNIWNRDTHLYLPHNKLSLHLTTATEVQRSGRIAVGMWSGWTTLQDSVLSSPTPAPTLLELPFREQRGFGLTASATISDGSAPDYKNRSWPLLQLVSVAQKNRPLTMLYFTVQSIDLPMDCMAWRFWMTRQSNACADIHGRRKDFFQEAEVDFSKGSQFFSRGHQKWCNFIFPSRNYENNLFCWMCKKENVKIQNSGRGSTPCSPFRRPCRGLCGQAVD